MGFFRVQDVEATEVLPGIRLKSVGLENLMMTFVEYEPGCQVPLHHHRYEQITYVLDGFLEVRLGSETRVLGPGEGVRIPARAPHGSRPVEGGARAVDAWSPAPKSLALEELATMAERER